MHTPGNWRRRHGIMDHYQTFREGLWRVERIGDRIEQRTYPARGLVFKKRGIDHGADLLGNRVAMTVKHIYNFTGFHFESHGLMSERKDRTNNPWQS